MNYFINEIRRTQRKTYKSKFSRSNITPSCGCKLVVLALSVCTCLFLAGRVTPTTQQQPAIYISLHLQSSSYQPLYKACLLFFRSGQEDQSDLVRCQTVGQWSWHSDPEWQPTPRSLCENQGKVSLPLGGLSLCLLCGAQPEPCRIWSYQMQHALPTSLCQSRRVIEWAVGRRAKVETKCCLRHFTVHFHRMVVEVDKENKTQFSENGWFSEFLVASCAQP